MKSVPMLQPHASFLPDEFLPMLDELNRIVRRSGARLAGNYFYRHKSPGTSNPTRENISAYHQNKRHNYAAVCAASKRILEVGVNAGHSALLALAHGIEYHGVDIGTHHYTPPAVEFLKKTFGERFHYYEGDSLMVLPAIRIEHPQLRFDLLHIDGNHHVDYCRADTYNAIMMAEKNAWILIDDVDAPHIGQFIDEQVRKKLIIPSKPNGWLEHPCHAIGKVNWP